MKLIEYNSTTKGKTCKLIEFKCGCGYECEEFEDEECYCLFCDKPMIPVSWMNNKLPTCGVK